MHILEGKSLHVSQFRKCHNKHVSIHKLYVLISLFIVDKVDKLGNIMNYHLITW